MFLYHETYYVTPGLREIIDERVRSLQVNHATHASFIAGDWLRAVGDPLTHVAYRLWQTRDNDFDAAQMAFMSEYNRTRPADSFIHPPDIEFFEQLHVSRPEALRSVEGATGATCFVQNDLELANRALWRSSESSLRDALVRAEGFHEYRLYRFSGNENRFMRAELWRDRAAADAFWHGPRIRERMAELGPRPFRRTPRISYFDVLHQNGDPRRGAQT